MAIGNLQVGNYKIKTSSGNVKAASDGAMLGFFCNSTSTGTIIFYDDPATGTTTPITGTITPTAGTWYQIPVAFSTGLNAVIANTLNVTIVYV